jgi:hypothetical protein
VTEATYQKIPDHYVKSAEAADMIGIPEDVFRELAAKGSITTPWHIGREPLYEREVIESLVRDLDDSDAELAAMLELREIDAPKDKSVGSYVYFLESNGLIKIGRAKSIKNRLRSLRSGSSSPIRLIHYVNGGKSQEAIFHKRFKHLRQHLEWFLLEEDLRDYLVSALRPHQEAI